MPVTVSVRLRIRTLPSTVAGLCRSFSTQRLQPPCVLRCRSLVEAMIHTGPKCGCLHEKRASTYRAYIRVLEINQRQLECRSYSARSDRRIACQPVLHVDTQQVGRNCPKL